MITREKMIQDVINLLDGDEEKALEAITVLDETSNDLSLSDIEGLAILYTLESLKNKNLVNAIGCMYYTTLYVEMMEFENEEIEIVKE